MTVGAWEAFWLIVQRELRLSFRRPEQLLQPLVFFLIVTTLFPLGLSLQLSLLRDIAPGVLWVAALLSSLLSLDSLFKSDADDGTLEQLALSGHGLTVDCGGKNPRALAGDGPRLGAGFADCGNCAGHSDRRFCDNAAEFGTGHPDFELVGRHRCGLNDRSAPRQCAVLADRSAAGHAFADFWRGRDRSGDFGHECRGCPVFFGGAMRVHVHLGAVCGGGGAAHHFGMMAEESCGPGFTSSLLRPMYTGSPRRSCRGSWGWRS